MIEVKQSDIHHKGVFAKTPIKKGTRIIRYIGEKITKEEGDKRTELIEEESKKNSHLGKTYMFELDDEYDIDGTVDGNDARFMNHSCNPNCEFRIENGEIWIYAKRDVEKDEELTYNYGFDFDEEYHEHQCMCGSEKCSGYILAEGDWHKVPKDKIKSEHNIKDKS